MLGDLEQTQEYMQMHVCANEMLALTIKIHTEGAEVDISNHVVSAFTSSKQLLLKPSLVYNASCSRAFSVEERSFQFCHTRTLGYWNQEMSCH